MRLEDMVLFSVDDHIIEPANMYEGRIPSKFKDVAPKHHEGKNGEDDYWTYGGRKAAYIGSNAVVGRPREEYARVQGDLSGSVTAKEVQQLWPAAAAERRSLGFPSLVGLLPAVLTVAVPRNHA